MENQLKVSVLVPIYKVESYLKRTLDSIFNQTYHNIDYVFVNDGSPDNSLEVLNNTICQYGIDKSRYTIINHSYNQGIAASRVDCIANASGEYVLFVDSDDWIEPAMVESLINATDNGRIEIVGSDIMCDYDNGVIIYHHEDYADTCRENMIRCLNYDINTVLWKLLIRKSLFDKFKIGHINIGEDYIISIKLYYYAVTFRAIHKAFYHYVQYNQERLSFQILKSINDHIECVKEIESFLREKGILTDLVEEKILLRKFNIRSNFLTKQLRDIKTYRSLFPETNGIWRKIPYSNKEKLKFWMAENKLWWVLKLL